VDERSLANARTWTSGLGVLEAQPSQELAHSGELNVGIRCSRKKPLPHLRVLIHVLPSAFSGPLMRMTSPFMRAVYRPAEMRDRGFRRRLEWVVRMACGPLPSYRSPPGPALFAEPLRRHPTRKCRPVSWRAHSCSGSR